ncbi:hypothetical protein GCM10018793_64500 [Streptomyces sulfonofaciens]|uniref:WD40 repeat domain-containing protein n=1 Tax=Streptomyces sulfonofaciens TaxID=68272 RepID=A0A919GPG1_9ACTN|nr:hypothetical protein [Streptomyces sulfonofaciens]GHH87676.1 hypothetical protein GCM10018793_64500 [Streptomyces sulfonofaciens]
MRTKTKTAAGAAASMAAAALAVVTALGSADASVRGQHTTAASAATAAGAPQPPVLAATPDRTYDTFDANQGVAVDKDHFYAVNNRTITQHDKATGKPLLQFVGDDDGPIIHMDSATVVGDRLYAATSNYDTTPEKSSIEVFDTRTMKHVDTFSFGIYRGSLTWLDRHDGAWYAAFANYDEVPDGSTEPYGGTDNTQIVKLDDHFQVVQSWTVPQAILDKVRPMSNSGGSWGPDGRLWLTGHDFGEAYVMNLPSEGSDLQWVATVTLPGVEGQAIAWDRSTRTPELWTIKRSTKQVLTFRAPYGAIKDPAAAQWKVVGPGHFQK